MKFAVIPTRGDRPETLRICLEAIAPQVDRLVLVDNSDDGSAYKGLAGVGWDAPVEWSHLWHKQQPPNLSKLWNLGLEHADDLCCAAFLDGDAAPANSPCHYSAVLNDDAIVPVRWMETVVALMTQHSCAAGSFGGGGGGRVAGGGMVHREPGTTPLDQRMAGYAFVLAGHLRADEQFQWWCGDNDLDMQGRRAGGTLVLAGDPVKHLFPDRSTLMSPTLQARTGEDMRLFVQKWGFRPWMA